MTWREDYYADAHPGPADVALLVEVADSSLLLDRRLKLPLYAVVGIAESWLVDLTVDAIEVHSSPGPGGYGIVTVARRGEEVRSATVPGLALAVDDVLGPPAAR